MQSLTTPSVRMSGSLRWRLSSPPSSSRARLAPASASASASACKFTPPTTACARFLTSAAAPSPSPPPSARSQVEDLEQIKSHSTHPDHNITPAILEKLPRELHLQEKHPLFTIRKLLEDYFTKLKPGMTYYNDLSPVMSPQKAFDDLLIPPGHPGREPTDTYYVSDSLLLRPHTSSHQNEILKSGVTSFLCTGDVYRRDTIDATHYPAFHQMEGLHLFSEEDLEPYVTEEEKVAFVVKDMKLTLEGMAKTLFGDVQVRWVDEYFPFTDPSFELEILFRDEWMEVLGCGVVHKDIVANCGLGTRKGWAFGLGLERLAMVLFQIPDIRLFWSSDDRFLSQFSSGEIVQFEPYSKYPSSFRDVAFWTVEGYHENAFYELVREVAGDIVENVSCVDTYTNKEGRKSVCYRINYRHMDRSLTNEEVNILQEDVRSKVVSTLGGELR
eukprot:TRINITY_DN4599_c0_g1_i1.p1 TRINITY_DN4599_c0_g1~~TRINITY_DN4599_c0_g1_i1.p1  ORF type:complete len:449 (-),score=95.13 TRINITY_DN4599_c0_g1_i1:152-1477(-)